MDVIPWLAGAIYALGLGLGPFETPLGQLNLSHGSCRGRTLSQPLYGSVIICQTGVACQDPLYTPRLMAPLSGSLEVPSHMPNHDTRSFSHLDSARMWRAAGAIVTPHPAKHRHYVTLQNTVVTLFCKQPEFALLCMASCRQLEAGGFYSHVWFQPTTGGFHP